MIRRPPRSTRTDTLFPYTTLFRSGVVGSSMPIANGLGWAAKLDGKQQVSIANFGDGAANIGAFHESLNMAALWKLPVIFVCQKNRYAEHTSFSDSTLIDKLSMRAAGYGMPGVTVNGNDPDEMYGAASVEVERRSEEHKSELQS